MMDVQSALHLSQRAIKFDHGKRYDEAIFCYTEAANRLLKLINEKKCGPVYRKSVEEFVDRAEFLKRNNINFKKEPLSKSDSLLFNIEFMLLKASVFQEYPEKSTISRGLYENVVETCLKSAMSAELTEDCKKKLKEAAETALVCIEREVHIENHNPIPLPVFPDVPTDEISQLNISGSVPIVSPEVSTIKKNSNSSSSQKYTKKELNVLSKTSNINNKLYVPFHSYDAINEFKGNNGKFCDPDGKLSLTDKQKLRLKKWVRYSEHVANPVLISSVDSSSIKQTVISDCSFISSLSIAALYEKKFKKQLVTSIIYPQNLDKKPIYNPNGKYMIKLHINGVWRKVIVDDFFPIDEHGQLMCSQSEMREELWVSLLEKAYMKVMGGYDFPGSNSNIDLNALTGWIPERISIRKDSSEFDSDKVFRKLFDRMHKGDCLITLATGKLSKEDCDRAGLVETHAYAVLDMRCVESIRLIKVKNPWTHLRWKGNYSDRDQTNWTSKLKSALSYDPDLAAKKDDGVFWIDYDSVQHFFDVFYVNWNPELFPFTSVYHAEWSQCAGPAKDLYSVGDNPQYSLTVNNGKQRSAAVWILLTRHITNIDDFAENREYITVVVYESDKKIYIPGDPKPISEGVRINSPHYLCQLVVTKPGVNKYTLVVAQYEKTTTINYSLRVYSTVESELNPITLPHTVTKTLRGNWEGSLEEEKKFPSVKLSLNSKTDDIGLLMELRGPKQYSIAMELKQISSTRTVFYETKSTGPYRPGYTVLSLEHVPAGEYILKLRTFTAGQKGPFILRVDSTCQFHLDLFKM